MDRISEDLEYQGLMDVSVEYHYKNFIKIKTSYPYNFTDKAIILSVNDTLKDISTLPSVMPVFRMGKPIIEIDEPNILGFL